MARGQYEGRPTLLTPDLITKICGNFAKGTLYTSLACEVEGINYKTAKNWLTRGSKDVDTGVQSIYRDFFEETKRAKAKGEAHNVDRISRAADGGAVIERRTYTRKDGQVETTERIQAPDWHAAAWLNERQDPSKYGRQERKGIISDGKGEPMTIADIVKLSNSLAPLKAPVNSGGN